MTSAPLKLAGASYGASIRLEINEPAYMIPNFVEFTVQQPVKCTRITEVALRRA
jgi:hypothetical protein